MSNEVSGNAQVRNLVQAHAIHGDVNFHMSSPPAEQQARPVPGLPRELRRLFGRAAEVAEGRGRLEEGDAEGAAAVVVTGPPGIGKSAVALHLARLVAPIYPDGQFHVDLSLAAEGERSADLVQALLDVLRPGGGTPRDDHANRLAQLRAELAGQRVLLLIDDVVDEDALIDVVQLDGPFAVVCTSRARLSGLTGLVHLIELGPLPDRHGEDLVRAVTGPGRLTDPQVSALAEACAGHPLALHIASAHLARRPKADVDRYLEDITDPDRGVHALRAGQRALEPVLERSFAALAPAQAELFTTLGILPYMSVTQDVVAAVLLDDEHVERGDLGVSHVETVAELLDALFEFCLIEQIGEDRYVFHEVLYRFARRKSTEVTAERRAIVIRSACLMVSVRTKAATESIGFMDEAATVPAQANTEVLRELEADRPGAVALTELARDHEVWEPLVHLVGQLTGPLWNGGHWADLSRIHQCVHDAGTRSETADWTMTALHNLALAAGQLGDSVRAVELFEQCAEAAYQSDDPYRMHFAELSAGTLLLNVGRAGDAIPPLRNGLRFWRLIEDERTLAHALWLLGQAHLALGQLRRAEQYLHNSRSLFGGAQINAVDLWSRTAFVSLLRSTGRWAEAAQEAALDVERARAVGSREWEAKALLELARTPVHERPDTAPARPLEAALGVYRETGDRHGQVRALYLLADEAADRADLDQAATLMTECLQLALSTDDFEHAARALTYLATYHGGVGDLDKASECFTEALRMARYVGNPVVIAQTLHKQGDFLWHLGRLTEAVSHFGEAVRLLEGTQERHALAQLKAALGEALVSAGRWEEGANLLQPVVSALSDDAVPATQARAWRALAILYSRRGLHTEAMSAITKAFDHSERAGGRGSLLHCHMALAGVHARNEDWDAALEEYDKAVELAEERKDVHVLLTARGMAAVCRLREQASEQAAEDIASLLPMTRKLGMASLEAALCHNAGTHHARSGDHVQAITAFGAAADLFAQLQDGPLHATGLLNLARCHRELGNFEASREHAHLAFALFQGNGDWGAAGDALVLLGRLHRDAVPDAGYVPPDELVKAGQPVDQRVIEALRADAVHGGRPGFVGDRTVLVTNGARRINVSAAVRAAMVGSDIEAVAAHLADSRQSCLACRLLIGETAAAELILLRHPRMNRLMVRLAHPYCLTSCVAELTGKAPKEPQIVFEAECILLGSDRIGVIVDCYGGLGSHGDGEFRDLVLEHYRAAGLMDLRGMLDSEGGRPLDLCDVPRVDGGVQAHLEDNRLSISASDGRLMPPVPLNFFASWYHRVDEGSLTVVIGRNLQGMATDDPSYLVRAMALGKTVGGRVPLRVVRPPRNGRCPCMMRGGRKFKHCCGRSTGA
ncbi:NB-ARC domain-containing protein [Streptomyces sp. NPDC102467]|uniref:tetratricopeptide repeat protein n=1 Tax=Streptomyces sp. NPDC102467 TaxID=3366179 RepID=UPI00381DE922